MKKYLKKLCAWMLVLSAVMGLTACGDSSAATDVSTSVEVSEESTQETPAEDSSEVSSEAATEELVQEDVEEKPAKEPVPYVDKLDRTDEGFTLIWNDEFDGEELDTTKWDFQYGNGGEYGSPGWGNYELQYYLSRPENVKVENGNLVITAMHEEGTLYPYTSARIRTITNTGDVLFSTTYGRIEARIKMPAEEGLWPAFWLLPVDESIYGEWAASGELDIMEAKGRLPGEFSCAAHYGAMWPQNVYSGTGYTYQDGTEITDYHLYSIEWEPDAIRYYLDNECYYTLTNWYSTDTAGIPFDYPAPFDVPFYIILNMAVGGRFDPEADVKDAEFPAAMEVDFVRVYHKTEGYETEE